MMKSTCKVHNPRAVEYHNGDGTCTCTCMYMYLWLDQLNTVFSRGHNLWAMISASTVDICTCSCRCFKLRLGFEVGYVSDVEVQHMY